MRNYLCGEEIKIHEDMANRKATMTDLRMIIREFAKGTPMREIERKLSLSRISIRTYKERAELSGKTMQELQALEDAELYSILSRNDVHRPIYFRKTQIFPPNSK